jgi:Fe2+ or Zn2+ uptake regulation protein
MARRSQAKTVRPDAREVMKRHGLRYSRPREAILAYFRERATHVSAEELHRELRRRGEALSLSTVYLNLGVLRDAGLVREFPGVNGEALFDSSVEPHHHLVCCCCGAVIDVPDAFETGSSAAESLKRQAEATSGWQVKAPSLTLRGLCPECQDV